MAPGSVILKSGAPFSATRFGSCWILMSRAARAANAYPYKNRALASAKGEFG
jgi:hypothetical protein